MKMHFALIDIISVGIMGLLAIIFLCNMFFKMRKDKCVTVCSGCSSGNACSTKNFADKKIKIFRLRSLPPYSR